MELNDWYTSLSATKRVKFLIFVLSTSNATADLVQLICNDIKENAHVHRLDFETINDIIVSSAPYCYMHPLANSTGQSRDIAGCIANFLHVQLVSGLHEPSTTIDVWKNTLLHTAALHDNYTVAVSIIAAFPSLLSTPNKCADLPVDVCKYPQTFIESVIEAAKLNVNVLKITYRNSSTEFEVLPEFMWHKLRSNAESLRGQFAGCVVAAQLRAYANKYGNVPMTSRISFNTVIAMYAALNQSAENRINMLLAEYGNKLAKFVFPVDLIQTYGAPLAMQVMTFPTHADMSISRAVEYSEFVDCMLPSVIKSGDARLMKKLLTSYTDGQIRQTCANHPTKHMVYAISLGFEHIVQLMLDYVDPCVVVNGQSILERICRANMRTAAYTVLEKHQTRALTVEGRTRTIDAWERFVCPKSYTHVQLLRNVLAREPAKDQ